MELCSVLCGSLDGRGVRGRMDTCIFMAESLHCSPETITTSLTGYTPTQNKKFQRKKKLPPLFLLLTFPFFNFVFPFFLIIALFFPKCFNYIRHIKMYR